MEIGNEDLGVDYKEIFNKYCFTSEIIKSHNRKERKHFMEESRKN